jgi:4-amino-4-deoxy-L-arabinose transferase-like glycosyltransferase
MFILRRRHCEEEGVSTSRVRPHTRLRVSTRIAPFPIALLGAALILYLSAVLLLRPYDSVTTLDADEKEYWNLAGGLLSGGVDTLGARRTLPFPLILASLRSVVGDDYLRVQIALTVIVSFVPLLVYWLVRKHLQSERVGRLAAIGVALWPPFVRYGATIYADSIALLCFVWFLIAFSRAATREEPNGASWWRWLLAGALLALCIQIKPLYLLYTPFAFLLAFASTQAVNQRIRAAILLTVGCLVVLLPWSTYLSVREGRVLLVSANDGETLAGGLNPGLLKLDKVFYRTPNGRLAWFGPGKWLTPDATGYLDRDELDLPYEHKRALLGERCMAWIESHPREVAYITARKLLYMWGIYPFWNGLSQSIFGNFLLLPLLAAAGVALWRSRGMSLPLAMFWSLPIFCSLVACVSWGSWRFRMPGDLGLIVLAATMAVSPWGRRISGLASRIRSASPGFPGRISAANASGKPD